MKRFIVSIILLSLTTGLGLFFSRAEVELERTSFDVFPDVIGDWILVNDSTIGETSMKVLLVDDYIMRSYRNGNDVIGLYFGYYLNQREGKQVHSPRQCLPGAGWALVEKKVIPLKIKGVEQKNTKINYQVMGKGNSRRLFLWWYQGRSRIYANEYLNKLYLMFDSVTKNRTDGALVRLDMFVENNVEMTLKKQFEFIDLFIKPLNEYIPE